MPCMGFGWTMEEVRRRLVVKMIFRFLGEILEILKRFMVMAERKRQESC